MWMSNADIPSSTTSKKGIWGVSRPWHPNLHRPITLSDPIIEFKQVPLTVLPSQPSSQSCPSLQSPISSMNVPSLAELACRLGHSSGHRLYLVGFGFSSPSPGTGSFFKQTHNYEYVIHTWLCIGTTPMMYSSRQIDNGTYLSYCSWR